MGVELAGPSLLPDGDRTAQSRLRIASVCRLLPTPENPATGTFVASRLAALARVADVRAIQPVPYFPLVKPMPPSATQGERVHQDLRIEPAPMFYIPGFLKSRDGHWLARSARRKLMTLLPSWRPDLLDAHFGYPDGVGAVELAQALGIPCFVTVRGSETDSFRVPGIRDKLARALSTATGCICVSHSLARLLIGQGVPGARIRVIHNAVDRHLFRPASREQARQELGISGRTRLVVSVGHLISGKRHHVLVRAMAGLRARFGDIRLAVIGGPAYERDYPAELDRVVRECGVSDAVAILGRLPQLLVSTWLQAADVFALATEREGCCNAVLEALASGCPVVTTPVGDNPYFVKESVNGALVPVGDVPALEQALANALERAWDPGAISLSLRVGSWDDIAQRVLEFFAERMSQAR